jgi:hypothetical protein
VAGEKTREFLASEVQDAVDAASWRWKALDVAVKIAMPILLGVAAWTATTVLDHDKRLNVIEATRYTQEHAAADLRERDKERASIVAALAEIKVLLARLEEGDKATAARLAQIESELRAR